MRQISPYTWNALGKAADREIYPTCGEDKVITIRADFRSGKMTRMRFVLLHALLFKGRFYAI